MVVGQRLRVRGVEEGVGGEVEVEVMVRGG